MADVYAVTFIIIGILLSLPALLVALNLLLPKMTIHAANRLKYTPIKSFAVGLPIALTFLTWVVATAQANFGPLRASAFIVAFIGMGLGSIGAAGMSRLLAERLGPISQPNSELTHLVRGAIIYELACLTPFVGWFLFIPLVGIAVMGAATFGLLGWSPAVTRPIPTPATTTPLTHNA